MTQDLNQQLEAAIRDSLLLPVEWKIKVFHFTQTKASPEQKQRILAAIRNAEGRKDDILKKALKKEGNFEKFKHFVHQQKERGREKKEAIEKIHEQALLKDIEHELDDF